MRYVPRLIAPQLQRAARGFAALVVTGPRRAGKTTLLRRTFPTATYRLLEDPETVARVRSDPVRRYQTRGFVVHRPRPSSPPLHALRPGVQAVSLAELLEFLARR